MFRCWSNLAICHNVPGEPMKKNWYCCIKGQRLFATAKSDLVHTQTHRYTVDMCIFHFVCVCVYIHTANICNHLDLHNITHKHSLCLTQINFMLAFVIHARLCCVCDQTKKKSFVNLLYVLSFLYPSVQVILYVFYLHVRKCVSVCVCCARMLG